MRRRIVWLVVGVLLWATIGTGWYLHTSSGDVPLRVGMTKAEVDETLDKSDDSSQSRSPLRG